MHYFPQPVALTEAERWSKAANPDMKQMHSYRYRCSHTETKFPEFLHLSQLQEHGAFLTNA